MDAERFEQEVWKPNLPTLRRFVFKRARCDPDELDDIMALTMAAAYNSIDTYSGEGTLLAWLCGIAKHKAIDYQRRQCTLSGHGKEVAWPWRDFGDKDSSPLDLADSSPSPEGVTIREDTRQDVARVLAAMRPHYRELLQLKYLCELEMTEMAYVLGRSFKSVESMLVSARREFRAIWQQQTLPEGVS